MGTRISDRKARAQRPHLRDGETTMKGVAFLAVVLALLLLLEIVSPGGVGMADLTFEVFTLSVVVRIGIFSIIVVGLNILMGFAGQVSLGQGAFFGIGAYTTAVFTARGDVFGLDQGLIDAWWWPWILMAIGAVAAGLLAYVIGRPLLQLKGHYLAMGTLGFGIVVFILFRENFGLQLSSINVTGGFDGISDVPRIAIGSFTLWPVERFYVLVWVIALGVIYLGHNIVRPRFGRALKAIRGSELAAGVMGVDVTHLKAQTFAVSAVFASVAGSLFAHFQAAVSPTPFDFLVSVQLVIMAALGGASTIWGAPLGVAIVLGLEEILRSRLRLFVEGSGTEFEPVVFGISLIALMIFLPDGLAPRIKRLLDRRKT